MLETFETVCRKLGREPKQSTRLYLWRLTKRGLFPAPVQVSPRRIAWRSADIDAFITAAPPVKYAPRPESEVTHA